MRIPYELLTALANSLVNDTIFEIVKRLMEIQHVNEKHLMQVREQVETEHMGNRTPSIVLIDHFRIYIF